MIPVPGLTIDPATLLPYLEAKFKKWLGTDEATVELSEWFRALQASSLQLATNVYCVGMPEPIPFADLYQPTRLTRKGIGRTRDTFAHQGRVDRSFALAHAMTEREVSVSEFLKSGDDALIFAGPGWGKTTFLHYMFRTLLQQQNVLPILITLRRTNAIEDLERLVGASTQLGKLAGREELVILVDGYDEIDLAGRKRVSDALLRYQGLRLGRFFLTCRSYYDVALLSAPHIQIKGFSRNDKLLFVSTYLKFFGSKLDPVRTVESLEERGLDDFLSHPLLLTLACIVETTSYTNHPRSALRLLERALEVLSYKWDDQKLVQRERLTELDGRDRIELLKRVAYHSRSPIVDTRRVITLAREELALMHFDRADQNRVLLETAQFYGIFVPKEDSWEFVHRSLQDFLAAQYWVETGYFAAETRYRWDSRTAYAACLFHDATPVIIQGLLVHEALPTVAEIFSNAPKFNMAAVSEALIEHFKQPGHAELLESEPYSYVVGKLYSDFFRLADTRYLNRFAEACAAAQSPLGDLIVGYCTVEMVYRRVRYDHVTFDALMSRYQAEGFTFGILDMGEFTLAHARPLGLRS